MTTKKSKSQSNQSTIVAQGHPSSSNRRKVSGPHNNQKKQIQMMQANARAQQARDYATEQSEHAGEFIGERPFTSVGFAFAAGLAVGMILKR